MAKPENLDEYYEKMLAVRDQLKAMKNELKAEGQDLAGVTESDLDGWGLDADKAAYEKNRLDNAKDVYSALTAFDNASS